MPQAYRVRSMVSPEGGLQLDNLPFEPGAEVEVIVLADENTPRSDARYPLWGTPITYHDPTAPVDQSDWDAGR